MDIINEKTMGLTTLFENLTSARVKSLINDEEKLIIIINKGDLKKALKNKSNAEKVMKKRIQIIEFTSNIQKFIFSFIFPAKGKLIDENKLILEGKGRLFKEKALGEKRKNLKYLQQTIKKHFNKEIEVRIANG